jgi:SAM-dependent methyltransferase
MHEQLHHWLQSPVGQRVFALERKLMSEALQHVFGWQILQIGLWGDATGLLAEARTQRRAVVANGPIAVDPSLLAIRSRADQLAVASDSVDAVLLPHTLEHEPDPHEVLREVERILAGDGQLIVLGFRPFSGWGARHIFTRPGYPPGTERLISEGRIRDWLKLLGFEVTDARRYLFTWPWGSAAPRGQRFFETLGERAWPLFAGAYLIKARKRVYSLTPIRPRWRARPQVVGGLIKPTTRDAGGAHREAEGG